MDELRDNIRRAEPNPLAREVLTTDRGGVQLSMEVDPCSWLYPKQPTQVSVFLAGGGGRVHLTASRDGREIHWKEVTKEDLLSLFESVRLGSCARCKGICFDPLVHESPRGDLCESCFRQDRKAAEERFDRAMSLSQRRDDALAWASGYRWCVFAWVHPGTGDDYPISWFSTFPVSDDSVRAALKKRRSMVLEDFSIRALEEPQGKLPSAARDFLEVAPGVHNKDDLLDLARVLGGKPVKAARRGKTAVAFKDQSRAEFDHASLVVTALEEEQP